MALSRPAQCLSQSAARAAAHAITDYRTHRLRNGCGAIADLGAVLLRAYALGYRRYCSGRSVRRLGLSLPTVCGLFIAVVRAHPKSAAGRLFAAARANSTQVALFGGYLVAVFLILMGVLSL